MHATRIAVAGATGRLGRQLVEVLGERGLEVVPMSRATGIDVISGDGLADALHRVDAIVDAAAAPTPDEDAATTFFTTATRNLQEAGERAGVQQIVVVSIVGVERFETGYPAAKLVHERAMQWGPVPVRILRATQFHEFVEQLVEWGRREDMSVVPRMRMQPVAARTVAEALANIAAGPPPAGTAPPPMVQIAGPRQEQLVDLARLLAARRSEPLQIEVSSDRGHPASELYEAGALLPGPDAILAGPTFAEWVGARVPVA